jgi:hypothetical protein
MRCRADFTNSSSVFQYDAPPDVELLGLAEFEETILSS